jgi:hypothetical protein
MNSFDKVGLIINPVAGQGQAANLHLAQMSIAALGVRHVFTGEGPLGALAMETLPCRVTAYGVDTSGSRIQTLQLAEKLAVQALDLILVVGGDGTLADVAFVMATCKNSPPLLGIGAGSTNAGALITCTADEIDHLREMKFEIMPITGLLAYLNDELIGIGFNDCVLGFTVVATLNGQLRDVGVAEKFAGRNVPDHPRSIALPNTRVERNRGPEHQLIAQGKEVGTVIIGLAEPPFIAKAITGGVCLTAITGLQAGCLVADQPLVRIEVTSEETLTSEPIHSSYLSFDEKDRIYVTGVREGTGLCVDGTPLCLLTPEQEVSFGVRPEAIRAVKFPHGTKGAL